MSNYSQLDLHEIAKGDLRVVREANRFDEFISWTAKKLRCGKQQFLEHVAPQKYRRSTDTAFERLSADFDDERSVYGRFISLLNEYSLQQEAITELEKELCSVLSDLVPLEERGLSPDSNIKTGFQTSVIKNRKQPDSARQQLLSDAVGQLYLDSPVNQGLSSFYLASLDSTKLSLSALTKQTLAKRQANTIRCALYIRAVDSTNEWLYTLVNVAMSDTASAFVRATEARLDFDATLNSADGPSRQDAIANTRRSYDETRTDATTKLEVFNAHKIRTVERAVILLNSSACHFYVAHRDPLCATLRRFSVSIPADLNALLADRSLLNGVLTRDAESGSTVNVRLLARSVSLGALQVKAYTRIRVKDLLLKASTVSTSPQNK